MKNIIKHENEISSCKELDEINKLFQFFRDLLKGHEKFPKHPIAKYINTINAP